MSANYRKLGDYIEVLNRRNTDLKLGLDSVRGISNTKQITETSKATVDESVISKFYIINPGEFVYNPRTTRMGDKVGLAFNNTDKPLLFTFNNLAFKIKDSAKDKLLPNYLYLFFCRSEFDRYARINSWGSATELFLFEDLCNIKFTVPDLKEQEKIVNTYNAITKRIQLKQKINENLEKMAQCLFDETIKKTEKNGKLKDIATILMGQSPEGDSYNENGDGEIFYQGKSDFGNRFVSERVYTTAPTRIANPNDILLSVRAPVGVINITQKKCCIGRGLAAISSKKKQNSFLFYTLKSLSPAFEIFNGEGTVFGSINREGLENLEIVIPDENEIANFEKHVSKIDKEIENNEIEISKLQELKQFIISRISKR